MFVTSTSSNILQWCVYDYDCIAPYLCVCMYECIYMPGAMRACKGTRVCAETKPGFSKKGLPGATKAKPRWSVLSLCSALHD